MWRDIYRLTLTPELFLDSDNLRGLICQAGFASVDTLPAQVTETIDTLAEYLGKV